VLTLTGKYLGTNRETVSPKPGQTWTAFERVTVDVLVKGQGGNRVEACETLRDFPLAQLPAEGVDVTLEVYVDAYNSRYRLKAASIVGARRLATAQNA